MQRESYYYNNPADKETIKILQKQLEDKMLTHEVSASARKFMLNSLADELEWSDRSHAPEEKLFSFKEAILREGLCKLFSFVPNVSGQTADGNRISLTCESFENDRKAILESLVGYLTHRLEQAKAIGSDAASKWRKAILLAEKLISTPKLYDKVLELADEATLELEADMRLGKTDNIATITESLEQIKSNLPRKRKMGGKRIPHRNVSEWGKKQADVAADLNKSKVKRGNGVKSLGGCTIRKIKEWDRKYPNANNKNEYGYHAELRLKREYKNDYAEFVQSWAAYWASYQAQFDAWRAKHPASKIDSFRFKKPKLTTNFDLGRVSRDKHGEITIDP